MNMLYEPRTLQIREGAPYLAGRNPVTGHPTIDPADIGNVSKEFAERFKHISMGGDIKLADKTMRDYCIIRENKRDKAGLLDVAIKMALNAKGISGEGIIGVLQSAYASHEKADDGQITRLFTQDDINQARSKAVCLMTPAKALRARFEDTGVYKKPDLVQDTA